MICEDFHHTTEARGTPEKVSLLTENLVDNLVPIFYTFKKNTKIFSHSNFNF
jgi:hypothetical protein